MDIQFFFYLAGTTLGMVGMVYVLLALTDPKVWRRERQAAQAAPNKPPGTDEPVAANQKTP